MSILLQEIVREVESIANPNLQEDYDNSGLLLGEAHDEIRGILISLDLTEKVLDEAIKRGCNLIITHHPIIFTALKKFRENVLEERVILKAIRNNIAIYACHTSLDNVYGGVSFILAEKLGLINCRVLDPKENLLRKLVFYCPLDYSEKLKTHLFHSGAGYIGNYDSCSFSIQGKGSFRALDGADPFVGEINKIHHEDEERIEMVFPVYLEPLIIRNLLEAHPYEEVAYDIYSLNNAFHKAGSGVSGKLSKPMHELEFLEMLKETLSIPCVRHSPLTGRKISNISLCGGAGSFLIKNAMKAKSDVFLTADLKYHDFFLADNKILLADIGHYESEQFTKELLFHLIRKKFPNFAVRISEINTNPVNYL